MFFQAYSTYMDKDDVVIDADSSEGEELEIEETEERIDAKATKLKQELDKVKKEKQEYLDGWQRAKADYVNALKRFEEEKKGAVELGKVITVGAFLPVMDSLERAAAAGEIPESFQGIVKQLETAAHALVLEKVGVVGEAFNPNFHEALGQDETEDSSKEDTVTAVLETGWKSKEMVIRPAKVRVAHLKL
jgi:molecular chaperone GrpE